MTSASATDRLTVFAPKYKVTQSKTLRSKINTKVNFQTTW